MGDAKGQRLRAGRAVLVLDADQARAALAAGPALLLSAEGAAGTLGPLLWRAMIAEAAAGRAVVDALCCAAAAGDALAALRAGCRLIVLRGDCPGFARVAAIAAELDATVLPERPEALDLRGLDLRRPAGRAILARWLDTDNGTPKGTPKGTP